uniref:Uncharacterized protein n=1 Tax=Lutzomyia longipalpis TaxID=7200 RepID=A0A1B0CET8_LUTLO
MNSISTNFLLNGTENNFYKTRNELSHKNMRIYKPLTN